MLSIPMMAKLNL